MNKVMILMGSKSDLEYCRKIAKTLGSFGVDSEMRIASAHKVPEKVLEIVRGCQEENCIFITVAGRSNALSGLIDANTVKPVIASPPYSGEFGEVDIFSSLRMPSGVCPMTVLGAEQAALAAVKLLAVGDNDLSGKIKRYQEELKEKISKDDEEVK